MRFMHSHHCQKVSMKIHSEFEKNTSNRLETTVIEEICKLVNPRFCHNLHGDPQFLFHRQMPNSMFEYLTPKNDEFGPPYVAI